MRLVRLSYLAPDITKAILDGRQPGDLTAEKLLERSPQAPTFHGPIVQIGASFPRDGSATVNRRLPLPAAAISNTRGLSTLDTNLP
jgi:hypothetical protein